jgi:hypothetical protein
VSEGVREGGGLEDMMMGESGQVRSAAKPYRVW